MNGGPFDPNGKPPYPGAPNYGQPGSPPAAPSQAQGYGSPTNYGGQQPPQQSGFGAPGYPPPQGYGAPGGYPPPQGYGAPGYPARTPTPRPGRLWRPQQGYAPPNYAANPYAAPMTPYAGGMMGPPGMQGPASDVNPGLFGAIPCPTCGMATNARADGAAVGFFVAGIPGWLIASALMTNSGRLFSAEPSIVDHEPKNCEDRRRGRRPASACRVFRPGRRAQLTTNRCCSNNWYAKDLRFLDGGKSRSFRKERLNIC
ncbi:hypothetical protein OUZ56_032343 [Daphnia magna]|uniref:LITAF domain-containing protein n=1 Tax=Daphnia magna TaxID=35525 RepID=A0ABR0B8M5_9CRUS|nr:hypothetical protein OUZ56_032343 [Daphnia magna]